MELIPQRQGRGRTCGDPGARHDVKCGRTLWAETEVHVVSPFPENLSPEHCDGEFRD
jgi:hypothetical protein